MTRRLISSGSTFEADIGYSRAVVVDDWVFVSGTTGFDYASMTIADGIVEQAEQCLRNIETALRQAGSALADVVRVLYVVPDATTFRACWPVLRRHFGSVRPAAMMISAALADPRMKIEIEVTALRRSRGNRTPSKDDLMAEGTKKTSRKSTKNSLVANINRRRKSGTSRSKEAGTVSAEAYDQMKKGWPKSRKKTAR
jgi:enamine deaminase RidA (YjgF/YER057c/UK114 family)